MYICVCNGIRECELRGAARRFSGDVEETYAALGKQPNCGQCINQADAILLEERELAVQTAAA